MITHLLSLPVEIRLHIYSYLHQSKLHLDFCKDLAKSRLPGSKDSTRPSPVLSYLNKRKATSQWARDHGLHLLATSVTLRQEYISLMKRARTSLVSHCTNCLSRLLQHLVRDLRVRTPIFKEIWQKVEFFDHRGENGHAAYDVRVENVIAAFQGEIRAFYGHFDLLGADDVPVEMARSWYVERLKIIGRVPRKPPHGQAKDMGDVEDETNEQDEGDEEEMPRCYCNRPGVKELETRVKHWNVTNMSDPDSRQRQDLARAMRLVSPAPDVDQWRISRMLRGEYEAAGKSAKRLVVREEIWVVVRMGL